MIRNMAATKPAACTLGSPPPPVKRPWMAVWLIAVSAVDRLPVSTPIATEMTEPATNARARRLRARGEAGAVRATAKASAAIHQ